MTGDERAGTWFGADWNPEQWDRATWAEDVELMVRAGVNLATVGVFSWSSLEPRPGEPTLGCAGRRPGRSPTPGSG